jgi:hypothetical protein
MSLSLRRPHRHRTTTVIASRLASGRFSRHSSG